MNRNPVALIEFSAFMGISSWLVYSQFLAPRGGPGQKREPEQRAVTTNPGEQRDAHAQGPITPS